MHTVSFQMPEDMKAQLDEYASKMERSKGHLMRQAVVAYLEELDDYFQALHYKSSYLKKVLSFNL